MTTAGGGWTRCLQFVNTTATDVNNNTWFDNCVDWSMASWAGTDLMITLKSNSGQLLYNSTGSRLASWTKNNITSTAAVGSQYDVGQHGRLVTLANADKLMITGKSSNNGGCVGSLGNGYGILVYPSAPSGNQNLKMLVMPYLNQVSDTPTKRAFGQSNAGWFMESEISYSGGSLFNTCSIVTMPGQLGSFEFYVR